MENKVLLGEYLSLLTSEYININETLPYNESKTGNLTISIEGVIGCGKSSLLNIIQQNTNYNICHEGVELWQNITDGKNNNILQSMYNNKVFLPLFQTLAMATKYSQHRNIQLNNAQKHLDNTQSYNQVTIMERSLLSTDIFNEMAVENGNLSELNKNVIDAIHKLVVPGKKSDYIDAIIFIETPIETCYERINKRKRNGEEKITRKHLELCETIYIKHLSKFQKPILYLQFNNDMNNLDYINFVLKQITAFICNLEL